MAVQHDSDFIAARPPFALSIIAYRIADFIDQSAVDLRRFIIRSQTERALRMLSDRQLADIGVTRDGIAKFSRDAAAR